MNENERRRTTAREAWLTQLTPEERGKYELEHSGEVIPASPQVLEAVKGLVGMLDSGRSDLASRAKRIARGTDYPDEGDGLLWVPDAAERVQRILADDWHRDQCDCDAEPSDCIYKDLVPGMWSVDRVLDALQRLERPIQGRHQYGEDPAQQAQGDQVDAGPDTDGGQAEADRPGEQE